MRDQDADCVAKPRRTSRCCNSMGSRAFCDTRTGGMLIGYARVSTQETREESPEKRRRTPLTTFWAAETQLGTHSLCQEPSETGALSPSTLVRNAPLSVQNRTNLPDTLTRPLDVFSSPCSRLSSSRQTTPSNRFWTRCPFCPGPAPNAEPGSETTKCRSPSSRLHGDGWFTRAPEKSIDGPIPCARWSAFARR